MEVNAAWFQSFLSTFVSEFCFFAFLLNGNDMFLSSECSNLSFFWLWFLVLSFKSLDFPDFLPLLLKITFGCFDFLSFVFVFGGLVEVGLFGTLVVKSILKFVLLVIFVYSVPIGFLVVLSIREALVALVGFVENLVGDGFLRIFFVGFFMLLVGVGCLTFGLTSFFLSLVGDVAVMVTFLGLIGVINGVWVVNKVEIFVFSVGSHSVTIGSVGAFVLSVGATVVGTPVMTVEIFVLSDGSHSMSVDSVGAFVSSVGDTYVVVKGFLVVVNLTGGLVVRGGLGGLEGLGGCLTGFCCVSISSLRISRTVRSRGTNGVTLLLVLIGVGL